MPDRQTCVYYRNGRYTTGKNLLKLGTREYIKTMYGYGFKKNHQVPETPLPSQPADLDRFNSGSQGRLSSTWLGHATLMINMDGFRILTDPIFDPKVSILGPRRMNGAAPVAPDKIRDIDIVVISHDHHDHLNKNAIIHLIPRTKRFLVPKRVAQRLITWGVPKANIVELGWWQSYEFSDKLELTCTPSQHASGRKLKDRNSTLWASWVIKSSHFSVFFSGDTGYFNGFKQIGETYGPFDMTFLECGAYDDMWSKIHMFPEECVQAHMDLGGKLLHPIHWGTFNLSLHAWYDPMQRLVSQARKNNVKIATPISGQTIEYGSHQLGNHWWQEMIPENNSWKMMPVLNLKLFPM